MAEALLILGSVAPPNPRITARQTPAPWTAEIQTKSSARVTPSTV